MSTTAQATVARGKRQLPNNIRSIEEAPTPAKGRTKYSIRGKPGLALVVFPSARRVFYGNLSVGGKRTTIELGDFHRKDFTADHAAEKLHGEKLRRERPVDERDEVTFGGLFQDWLDRHAKVKLATWEDEESRYHRHLRDEIGDTKFATLERKDIREIRDAVAEKAGPIESNRVLALFQRVANWAVDEDRARFNPAARLKKTGDEKRRERILTDDEIKAIWAEITKALEVDGRRADGTKARGGLTEADLPAALATRRALQILFLTGQRRGEVADMRRQELDLKAGWWSLPGERTKNGLPHRVPLCEMAVSVLKEALVAAGNSAFVFRGKDPEVALIPDAVTKALQRICKRLKITGVGPHDIRRTIGTRLRVAGVGVEERGYLFNHVSGAKAKVTSWNYDAGEHDDEKRRAIEVWEHVLRGLIGLGETDNVAPMVGAIG
ncbi:MAG: tyrosine-type recombinase/integrase [Hyphomicrobiaceae bacterium]